MNNQYHNPIPTDNIVNNYYFCYSTNLYRELKHTNNIQYITKGINPSNNKTFWVFEKTDQVKEILTNWTNNRIQNMNSKH